MRKIEPRFPRRHHWLKPAYVGKVKMYQNLLLAQAAVELALAEMRQNIKTLREIDAPVKQIDAAYAGYSKALKKASSLGTKVNSARNAMVAELERTKL